VAAKLAQGRTAEPLKTLAWSIAYAQPHVLHFLLTGEIFLRPIGGHLKDSASAVTTLQVIGACMKTTMRQNLNERG
jgi:hypothetical protein